MADLDNIANLRHCIKSETHYWHLVAPVWIGQEDLSQDVMLAALIAERTGKKFGPLRVRTTILFTLRTVRHQSSRIRETKLDLEEAYRDLNIDVELMEDFFGNRARTPEEIYADKEERIRLSHAFATLPSEQKAEVMAYLRSCGYGVWNQNMHASVNAMKQSLVQ